MNSSCHMDTILTEKGRLFLNQKRKVAQKKRIFGKKLKKPKGTWYKNILDIK